MRSSSSPRNKQAGSPGSCWWFTAYCVVTEDDEIKFQLSRIAGDKLVNIQFIGTGSVDEGFEGTFTAMVEAEQRPDMSGTFALVPHK
jgi:hypothetical protein